MDSWVVVDFETANEYRGSPCAVAMVAVEGDEVVQQHRTLIQPPPQVAYFSPFCVSLHGITADQVRHAPSWAEAMSSMVRLIDGRTVVAHNAAFDMGVVRDACDLAKVRWPDLSYACTLVLARRTWPLISYSLPWVADAAGHALTDHHDPGGRCQSGCGGDGRGQTSARVRVPARTSAFPTCQVGSHIGRQVDGLPIRGRCARPRGVARCESQGTRTARTMGCRSASPARCRV